MAKDKKSFILYADQRHVFDSLSDKEAGELIKHIFSYVNDENPEVGKKVVRVAFEPIKHQLKRDLKEWEQTKVKRSEGGKKGMANRWQKITPDNSVKEVITPITVTGNGTVNVNDNVTVKGGNHALIYDAEKLITENQIEFERICLTTKKITREAARESLRKFHLFLEERDKYPQTKKQIFAGFEKWIMNESKFSNNGTNTTSASDKHRGAKQLINSLKQDFAAGRKENP